MKVLRKRSAIWILLLATAAGGIFASIASAQLPPNLIFREMLDTDPGWSTQGQWAFGVPAGNGGDPAAGFTGANVYGYNLAGQYSNNLATTFYLTTPAISCTGFTYATLSFQRWLRVESKSWDHATIDVSSNGSVWSNVWENPASMIQDLSWTNIILDISSIADGKSTVYIRWGIGPTDGSVNYCGWNLDDVELWGLDATTSVALFSANLYSFRENAGTATVSVLRSGLLTGTSTVYFAATNGTAAGGSDFVPTNGVLTFNPGVTSMHFAVDLLNDASVESNEYISLVLSNASPGTVIGSPGTARILIRDDEAPKAPFPFYEPFDGTVLSNYWSVYTTTTARTRISTSYTPYYSSGHLCMDSASSWTYGLNEAVLTVNLLAQTSVILNVWTKNFYDEPQTMPDQFDGSVNADGIALSDDGVRWHTLWTPIEWDYSQTYTNILIDLSAFATARGIPLTDDFLIKIQQYDHNPLTSCGRCYDEVRLYDPSTAADIRASVMEAEDPAQTGSNLLYTIFVTNAGPATATGLAVSNRFPGSMNILSATSSVGTCSVSGSNVVCAIGDFPAGATSVIWVLTHPAVSGTATVTVYAASQTLDLWPLNNRAVQTTLISEPGGFLQFQNVLYEVTEGSSVILTVTRTNALYGTVQVNYTTSNGTAMAGSDYTHASGTLTFTSGIASGSFTVTLPDDSTPEAEKSFKVFLSAPGGGAVIGIRSNATVTIRDDDPTIHDGDGTAAFPFVETFESGALSNFWGTYCGAYGRLQITSNFLPHAGTNHVTMDANDSSALNELVLNIDLAGQQGVVLKFWQKEFGDEDDILPASFTNHHNGDGVAVSADGTNWYTAQGLTSINGISNSYQQFEVPLDGLIASNGLFYNNNFKIKFQQYDDYAISWDGFAFDDISLFSLAGSLQFGSNAFEVNEYETSATVTVVRTGGSQGAVNIDYRAIPGTADGGTDFTPQTGTMSFASGQLTNTFTVPILDDDDDEPVETVQLQLFNPAGGAALGMLSNAPLNIIDDDGPGDFRFAQPDFSFPESVNVAVLSVERINGRDGTVSVGYVISAGSATAGTDYTDSSGYLLFSNNQLNANIEIGILNDYVLESNEIFTVALYDPSGGSGIESPSNATVTIIDDDLAFFQGFEGTEEDNWNCTFYPGAGSIATNSTRAQTDTHCLRMTGSSYSNADPYVIFDNVDISLFSNVFLSLAFSASGPDTDDDLWLDISYDNGSTWNGTGSVQLVDGYGNCEIPFAGTASGDPLTVSNNPWTVAIPDSAGQIKVRLRFDERTGYFNSSDNYYVDDVRLYYLPPNQPPVITAAGTVSAVVSNLASFSVSAADIDHDPITLTASNMPAGAVFLVITNAEDVAGIFSFTADVSQAGNVYTSCFYAADKDGINFQAVVITISDKQVNILHAPRFVDEEGGLFSITVSVSRAAGTTVDIAFGGTASNGTDYTAGSTSLYFAAGDPVEQTISITATDDSLPEGLEKIVVSLANVLNGEIGPDSSETIELRDNDSFTLAAANLTTTGMEYKDPGNRIIEGVRPDILAIQEFSITNASYRDYVDRYLGTDYYYVCETNKNLPNGVISRWPITAWGQWDDPQLSDREFVWTTIDIPGSRDLHVISVHLYASAGAAAREMEARDLTNYIALAGFDPGDYFAICGDFNTQVREEACIVVLTQVVSDVYKPADQAGVTGTSAWRDYPYDRVLPNPGLDARHMSLNFEELIFPEGMVFDSRLWTNPPPPSPVLTDDSGAQDMQHMLVMKLFSLKTNFVIFTAASGQGSINPANPEVAEAGQQPFSIAAAAYHHISSIRTNGNSMSLTGAPIILDFTWSNILRNGTLEVTFSENLADHNVPEWWLASHGWTDNFDAVVNTDSDNDCLLTWEEYYANTIPTNENSCLMFEDVGAALAADKALLSWQSASGRLYKLSVSTNNFASFDVLADDIIATPAMNVYTVQVINANGAIYRISIEP